MKKVFQRAGGEAWTLSNAAKMARGAVMLDSMESLVTLKRAVFTGVMGTDTTLQWVESSERWKQTINNIKNSLRKGTEN